MNKWIYTFGGGQAEGDTSMGSLLGGKGANLAEMASLGLPVPAGFTITTEACDLFFKNGKTVTQDLLAQIEQALLQVEKLTERKFGGAEKPLLVSVRSGSRVSMPGMMDTVLNLGLNDQTVEALAQEAQDERFAYDSYRRFIQMYSSVVLGIDHDAFEALLDDKKAEGGYEQDTDVGADDWKQIVTDYKALVESELGQAFPQDPLEQLSGAIGAVFSSWMNPRANIYRKLNNISADGGTAANIQAMVFGNMGDTSATGVAFTRNPSTGDNLLYGEFLVNAQGEDVVAGIRTPQDLTEEARIALGSDMPSLEKLMPQVFQEFKEICNKLEVHYKDMQDLEFTVQQGKLWMLQARSGKRTAKAALRIAVDMVEENLITREEAVASIDAVSLDQLLHPTIAEGSVRDVIATGLPASPGAATGQIVFNPDEAEELKAQGENVILVRVETSPEDIHGMHAAQGILTQRGGMTSHAAVVARGMGKPCVCGAGTLRIDLQGEEFSVLGRNFKKGEIITIDGSVGQIMAGSIEMVQPALSGAFGVLMKWADEIRRMDVRCNADTPRDAKAALSFGAEGIGLCRTEHMFFEGERIVAVREMILAEDEAGRRKALAKLLPMQRQDFAELFTIMAGQPVTIRLLDPPLHEFLPHSDDEILQVADAMGVDVDILKQRAFNLGEVNPMMGHRGCRLAISYPEIAEMQARAIFESAIQVGKETGRNVQLEIMVPLISLKREYDFVKERIDGVAKQVIEETGVKINYLTGTMIELPRAALKAGEIAKSAEFFSIGTNDLTQTTLGISRDDAAQFLSNYEAKGIIERDPFTTLDIDGVGELVKISVERGRQTSPTLKIGICGEHGGDPASVLFFEEVGMDYVSCSPFRVPIARLAAAQATVLVKNSQAD